MTTKFLKESIISEIYNFANNYSIYERTSSDRKKNEAMAEYKRSLERVKQLIDTYAWENDN